MTWGNSSDAADYPTETAKQREANLAALQPQTGAGSAPPEDRSPPHPHHFGHLLEGRNPDSVTRVLKMFTANGNLSDYDDELANRVHDAMEIVEKVPKLADTLVWVLNNAGNPNLSAHVRQVLESLQIDPLRWKSP